MNRYTHVFGRVLICVIFLVSGAGKLGHWSATAAQMVARGVPAVPLALPAAVLIELGCGSLLLVGYRARLAAGVLVFYLLIVTLVEHNFWALQGPQQQMQLIQFLKNLAILGGLLRLMSDGAGAISLDALRLRASFTVQAGSR